MTSPLNIYLKEDTSNHSNESIILFILTIISKQEKLEQAFPLLLEMK